MECEDAGRSLLFASLRAAPFELWWQAIQGYACKNVVGRALRLPNCPMGHPPRIPVWLRWEQSVTYFVTICVANRKPVLANKEALKAFSVAASKLQDWRVLAAMLMPDHLHVVVAPAKDHDAKL